MQKPHNQDQEPIKERKLPGADDTLATDYSGASAENAEGVEVDKTDPLDAEKLLKETKIRAAEHHDAWLRAKAENENVRKRAQADVANAHKYAIDNLSIELLAVMDSLEAALVAENSTIENLKDGVKLTRKQLTAIFEKFSVHVVDPQGEKFDPHRHEAMCTVESDLPPNTVTQVMQKGYVLHDRVIRPAMVAVSKARDA